MVKTTQDRTKCAFIIPVVTVCYINALHYGVSSRCGKKIFQNTFTCKDRTIFIIPIYT